VTRQLKSGIVEGIEAVIARQQRGKYISTAMNQNTAEDLLEQCFLCGPCRGYIVRANVRSQQLGALSCRGSVRRLALGIPTVSSHYLAMTNNDRITNRTQCACCSCSDLQRV
jgi:hypothetical protein